MSNLLIISWESNILDHNLKLNEYYDLTDQERSNSHFYSGEVRIIGAIFVKSLYLLGVTRSGVRSFMNCVYSCGSIRVLQYFIGSREVRTELGSID